MCSRDTIASSTWSNLQNECHLIDIYFFSACSVDMLPPRPSPLRHSHLSPSPTYTRFVFEGRFDFFCVCPSGGRLHPHTSRRTAAAGRHITLCTYLQLWRGTVTGLRSFRAGTTTRMQLEGRNVPCKQYCTSGLQQHQIFWTEDVTAARRTLQRL